MKRTVAISLASLAVMTCMSLLPVSPVLADHAGQVPAKVKEVTAGQRLRKLEKKFDQAISFSLLPVTFRAGETALFSLTLDSGERLDGTIVPDEAGVSRLLDVTVSAGTDVVPLPIVPLEELSVPPYLITVGSTMIPGGLLVVFENMESGTLEYAILPPPPPPGLDPELVRFWYPWWWWHPWCHYWGPTCCWWYCFPYYGGDVICFYLCPPYTYTTGSHER